MHGYLKMNDEYKNDAGNAGLRAFITILLIVFASAIFMMRSFSITILMGSLLAILSYPLHRKLQQKLRPIPSALIVTLFVVLLVAGPAIGFAGMAIKQGIVVAEQLAKTDALSMEKVLIALKEWGVLEKFLGEINIEGEVRQGLRAVGRATSKAVLTFAKSLPEGVMKLFLATITCFFLLLDGKRFLNWSYARLPLSSDIRTRLTGVFADTAISVVWATMTAAGVQALIMTASFLALSIPAAFFAGGLTFMFAFIPLVGSVPVWLGGSAYLLVIGSPIKALILLSLGFFTATIDNFIRPWVLKGRNEMHPLIALLAIIGGIETFGLAGVFVGPILAALLISLLQIWPIVGLRFGLDFGTGISYSSKDKEGP